MTMSDQVGQGKIRLMIVTYQLDDGGVEEIILTYARLLDPERYRIAVCCLATGRVAQEVASVPGIQLVHVAPRSRMFRFLRMWKVAREFRPHIVHNHACWYGLTVGWLVGARRVETMHNVYHWLKRHERFWYGLYCQFANAIIAVSRAVKEFNASFIPLVRGDHIAVVHNGISSQRFHENAHPLLLRAQLSISSNEVVVGFVGRLTLQKGVTYLLQSAAALSSGQPPLRFVIVGDGDLREQLQAEARSLGLTNVLFVGYQRNIPQYLQMFDIFVLPSLWEGLPVSVLEAMASARPVVATAVGGTPEVVEEKVTGFLVEQANVQQLVERLRQLIASAQLRQQMGREGQRRVAEQFTGESMVRSSELLYNRLLGLA